MAVVYGATGAGAATGAGFVQAAAASWSHTIAAGDTGVIVSFTQYSNGVNPTSNTYVCTYGGTNMTLVTRLVWDPNCSTSIYYMLNPPSGAQTVAVSASTGTYTGRQVEGNSVSYAGLAGVSVLGSNTGNGGSATLSGLAAGTSNDLTYFTVSCWGGASGQTFTQRSNIANPVYPQTNQQIGDTAGTATSASTNPNNAPFGTWGVVGVRLLDAVSARDKSGDFFTMFQPL